MRDKNIFFFLLALFVLLTLAGLVYSPGMLPQLPQQETIVESKQLLGEVTTKEQFHLSSFFQPQNFYRGVNEVDNQALRFEYEVKGGIIPHHLFASELLSDFFVRLSHQAPKTVILLGPNHEGKGKEGVLTSSWNWETPFGPVYADTKPLEALLTQDYANEDNEIVGNEHSVAGMMPYLAYYLPNTKVVPIILSSKVPLEKVEKLGEYLTGIVKVEGYVVVASVDFSHGLTSEEAAEKDTESEQVIRSFDLDTLFTFGNEHLDSPQAVGALLVAMQSLGTTNIEILRHTNSGFLLGAQTPSVTSYFETVFQ